jgi:hypothetical protein
MTIDPSEYVSISECAARLPSTRAGKKVHPVTVRRLARKHSLPTVRLNGNLFIHWPSVLALFEPVPRFDPPPKSRPSRARARQEWTQKVLREAGLA